MKTIFECRQCGKCCEGEGGITLSSHDLERICEFLELPEAVVRERHVYSSNGKDKIKSAENGLCVFFKHGEGCSIHSAKPDVCRAWPFFRGNMLDPQSLEMAKGFCPGISKECDFESFFEAGREHLSSSGILAASEKHVANALNYSSILTFSRAE